MALLLIIRMNDEHPRYFKIWLYIVQNCSIRLDRDSPIMIVLLNPVIVSSIWRDIHKPQLVFKH